MTIDPEDEVRFWAVQMTEHAALLADWLLEPQAKARAMSIRGAWEGYRRRLPEFPSAAAATNEATPLLAHMREFKADLVRRLDAGEPLGPVYPSLVAHMLRELDYFRKKLQGAVTPQDETCFWLEHHAEEALLGSHLVDPSELKLTHVLDQWGSHLAGAAQACRQGQPSAGTDAAASFAAALGAAGLGTAKVKSIMTPALAAHVAREVERGNKILASLAGPPSPARVV